MNGPDLLKRWRTSRGLSQSAAGELVDVHQNTWSDWEGGKKTPQTTTALRLHVLTSGACPVEAWSDDADVVSEYLALRDGDPNTIADDAAPLAAVG
jgi:DNA-binding XRE family transcriptional regulator